jgi:hypothetical protein
MAKIAVGVSRWVQRLQAYAVQPPSGLVTDANRSLEVRSQNRTAGGRVVRAGRAWRQSLLLCHLAPVAPFGPQLFFCPALQLLEITSHMAAAVNEEYIARLIAGVT